MLAPQVGCGDTASMTGFSSGPSVTTVTPSSTSSGSTGSSSTGSGSESGPGSTSSGSTTSTSPEDTTGPKLDMPVPDGGSGPPIGCAGKIDFLVAVSANSTMQNQQELLITSFPDFIDTIKAQLPEFDVHIMSAASHPLWAFKNCADCDDPMCDPDAGLPFCGVQPEFCDKGKTGASVTFPVGTGASNRRCDLFGGNRFIVGDEPNMKETFGCIAQVGISGGGSVAEGMVRAIGNEWVDGPNKCNKGFLRDDALLVVVLIQDTYDESSEGTVESWIEALREAKHGDDDAFAVLALTTDVDEPNCEGVCIPWDCTALNPNRLRQLINGVEHGFIGSICMPFAPFFEKTVAHIVELCENFVIPQ
ncbi:hypothetical protein OV203_22680 [Nannocystis sp. ILAH1]|uniref:hypothetical protein n=1 Tax=Nannocystis sp. ILAH1 TaxID=2996789 RepID=UPI002270B7B3|nr:hypothetical protein [Nannocystis sp. ILAH1]MCY0989963.1 hypothetical protein [Nannocystis sp. ILAH1]